MNDKVEWDCVDDVLAVLELARKGEWEWFGNSKCKYIELRIDMRDGYCILRDREGNRISPDELRRQNCEPTTGMGWAKYREQMHTSGG